jgi:hypothetical protein
MSFAMVKSDRSSGISEGVKGAGLVGKERSRIAFCLQKALISDRPEGAPCFLFLRHIANGKVGDKVDSQRIDNVEVDKISDLAMAIYETAANDAYGYGTRSPQRYILQVYSEEKPTEEPNARVIFQVSAGAEIASGPGSDIESDPPTDRGVAQMLMRHMERKEDQQSEFLETVASVFSAIRQQVQDLKEELRETRIERRADLEAVEKAKMEMWKRSLEEKRIDAEIETKRQLIDGLKLLGPAIARRVGAIDPKMPIAADEMQMIRIAESLTEDQMGKIMAAMSDNQRVAFVEWYEAQRTRIERMQPTATAEQKPTEAAQG